MDAKEKAITDVDDKRTKRNNMQKAKDFHILLKDTDSLFCTCTIIQSSLLKFLGSEGSLIPIISDSKMPNSYSQIENYVSFLNYWIY